jgi:hypothetical protein
MVTNQPSGQPPVNSKHYSFTLEIVTGGMRFPISFVQAIKAVSSSVHTSVVLCIALLPYLLQAFCVSLL